jgi:hypothetical protein
VALAAGLLAEHREAPLMMTAAKLSRLESLLGRFGMTPSDRAKLEIPGGGGEESPFALLGK